MATGTSLLRNQGGTSLTTEETNPAETKVGQLEMTVLVDEQVVGLEITTALLVSFHDHGKASTKGSYRCTIPRWWR